MTRREWWNADLEGEMEKLAAEGSFSFTAGGSMNPERKAQWSTRTMLTKEESEGVEVEEATRVAVQFRGEK